MKIIDGFKFGVGLGLAYLAFTALMFVTSATFGILMVFVSKF